MRLAALDAVVRLAHIGNEVTIATSIAKLSYENERVQLAAVNAVCSWQTRVTALLPMH